MATGFEGAQVGQLPPWLNNAEGQAFEATFGRTKDNEQALTREATKTRWPTTGADDALELQGRDRLIHRAPSAAETLAAYRLRIQQPHALWLRAGTKSGIVDVFAPYGYTSATCHVYNNYELVFDGNTDWFSRVFILLDSGFWSTEGVWDDPGTWDDGGYWDSSVTTGDLDYIRRAVRTVKSVESYPVFVGIALDDVGGADGYWEGPGTWDDGGLWDVGDGGAVFIPLGHVWDEEVTFYGETYGLWDDAGDVWDDFVPPTGGWNLPWCF